MAEHFSFFDAILQDDGTYDREYNAEKFTKYFGALVTTGILKGMGNMLAVSGNGSNMVTKINTGIAFVEAKYYENDSFKELTHDTETLGNSRIDRIVIRMDLSTEARYVKAFIKKGVPSTNPVAPTLTQTANLYEISLAQVKVIGGQTFIATNAVTDERGKDVICPWAGSKILPNFDDVALEDLIAKVDALPTEFAKKANKKQSDRILATLDFGWTQGGFNSDTDSLYYWKDEFGIVHVQGGVKNVGGYAITQLPVGYRPYSNIQIPCFSYSGSNGGIISFVNIRNDGYMLPSVGGSSLILSFSFRAEL